MKADNKEQKVLVKFCFLLGTSAVHPFCSPDLAPCDFSLCHRMKGQMKGKRFADVSEVKKKTLEVLNNISTEMFSAVEKTLVQVYRVQRRVLCRRLEL
jgi:hypothetical protein